MEISVAKAVRDLQGMESNVGERDDRYGYGLQEKTQFERKLRESGAVSKRIHIGDYTRGSERRLLYFDTWYIRSIMIHISPVKHYTSQYLRGKGTQFELTASGGLLLKHIPSSVD